MREYLSHIVFFSALVLVLAIGMIGNIGIVGQFFGAMLAMIMDPVLVIGALVIGTVFVREHWLVLSAVVFSIALSAYIAYINVGIGVGVTPYMVFVRLVAILGVAFIVNLIRIIATSRKDGTA